MANNNTGFSGSAKIAIGITADVANIPTVSSLDVNLTVPGSRPEFNYLVSAPALEAGLQIIGAKCTTAGTVIIRIGNNTVSDINPASQLFNVLAF